MAGELWDGEAVVFVQSPVSKDTSSTQKSKGRVEANAVYISPAL